MNLEDAAHWKDLIDIAAQGASGAAKSMAQGAKNKRDLKESKRQTYADLLKNAMRRDLGLYKADEDYSGDMTDLKSNAVQNLARGFAESFRGSTRRRRHGNV